MDQNGKDDLKTQFITREGTYRLITLSEYSRPNRVGYQSNQNNPQVRVSLLPAKVCSFSDLFRLYNYDITFRFLNDVLVIGVYYIKPI